MIILTVNAGSTSVKLALFVADAGRAPKLLARASHSGTDLDAHALLGGFLAAHARSPDAVAHRVVHGGAQFTRPTVIGPDVEARIAALSELAPLHNPAALRWIAAARGICPQALHVVVFDTAFFADMPRVAAEYAIPPDLAREHGVRRYGFHGIAHEAMWRRWCELRPDLERGGRLITLHLGGGCSMAAIDRGHPLDTSMGFSPLEGLVMATRCGDIDPSVVPFLARHLSVSAEGVLELLNKRSGLLGVSGRTSSAGELLADADPQAQLAVEQYCYRARKYVGAYLAVLGGADGIVFGGGVGEHVPEVRERILQDLEWAGIVLDRDANRRSRSGEARLSAPESRVDVFVVETAEEPALARAALTLAAVQS